MKIIKNAAVLVICGLLLVWSFSSTAKIDYVTNYPPKNDTIVAFGDSLVEGYDASRGDSDLGGFVSILSKKIGRPIINLGHYGDTTEQGLARIWEVTAINPGTVIVLFGGDDALGGVPSDKVFSNMRKIVSTLQARGAVVILLGIRNGILVDTYKTQFEKLASDTGTLYVPDMLSGIFGNEMMISDPVHPNSYGYEFMASKIYPELKKILKK